MHPASGRNKVCRAQDHTVSGVGRNQIVFSVAGTGHQMVHVDEVIHTADSS